VLLDPGRKTTEAFSVEGIPKSFIFDAQGQLVAEAMDMRTERQFLDLLKERGSNRFSGPTPTTALRGSAEERRIMRAVEPHQAREAPRRYNRSHANRVFGWAPVPGA
jgi:hypothetical protein